MLKPMPVHAPPHASLITVQDNTMLKLMEWIASGFLCLITVQDNTMLKLISIYHT